MARWAQGGPGEVLGTHGKHGSKPVFGGNFVVAIIVFVT